MLLTMLQALTGAHWAEGRRRGPGAVRLLWGVSFTPRYPRLGTSYREEVDLAHSLEAENPTLNLPVAQLWWGLSGYITRW